MTDSSKPNDFSYGVRVAIASMIGQTFSFKAELDLQRVGTYTYHAIKIPPSIQSQMAFSRGVKQRFVGSVGAAEFSGALMPTGSGGYYMMVNSQLRKQLGAQLGDTLTVELTIVDPNEVQIPTDVYQALSEDELIMFKWDNLSAGSRRGFLHEITSARTSETRRSRIDALVQRIQDAEPFEPIRRRGKTTRADPYA